VTNNSSVVTCVFVAVGTCFLSRYVGTIGGYTYKHKHRERGLQQRNCWRRCFLCRSPRSYIQRTTKKMVDHDKRRTRPLVREGAHMERTVTFKQEEICNRVPQPGLDAKTDRLTDRQSRCDFDFVLNWYTKE
jgi:hypothetical protein